MAISLLVNLVNYVNPELAQQVYGEQRIAEAQWDMFHPQGAGGDFLDELSQDVLAPYGPLVVDAIWGAAGFTGLSSTLDDEPLPDLPPSDMSGATGMWDDLDLSGVGFDPGGDIYGDPAFSVYGGDIDLSGGTLGNLGGVISGGGIGGASMTPAMASLSRLLGGGGGAGAAVAAAAGSAFNLTRAGWRQIGGMVKKLGPNGLSIVAGALGVGVGELAAGLLQSGAMKGRRRRRGISSRDIRTTRRVVNFVNMMVTKLGCVHRPHFRRSK